MHRVRTSLLTRHSRFWCIGAIAACLTLAGLRNSRALAEQGAAATQPISFRREVAPILLAQCQKCHGPEKSKSKFRLDTFQRLGQPGESRAAPVTAGKPGQSEIYRLLTADDDEDR